MIELDHISKRYPHSTSPAIDDVCLTIAGQSFVALLGASGSGKTTILKTINQLIHQDHGNLRINGINVNTIAAPILRRGIGYVFQGSGLFPHLSIAENISITPHLLDWPKEKISSRVKALLNMVDLPFDFANRFPNQLSGGQQQRVAIARALAANPPIMLMDEPFSALDPITRDKLGSEYRQLHQSLSITTVMVSHDIQEALLLADRIIILKSGQIIADFLPHQALQETHPDVQEMMAVPLRQAKRVNTVLRANIHD